MKPEKISPVLSLAFLFSMIATQAEDNGKRKRRNLACQVKLQPTWKVLEFIVKHYATRWQYEMDEQSIQRQFSRPTHPSLYVTQFRLLSLFLCPPCDTCFFYLAPCTVIHVKCSPSPNIQVKLSHSI